MPFQYRFHTVSIPFPYRFHTVSIPITAATTQQGGAARCSSPAAKFEVCQDLSPCPQVMLGTDQMTRSTLKSRCHVIGRMTALTWTLCRCDVSKQSSKLQLQEMWWSTAKTMKRTTDFSTLMASRRGYQNHPKSIAEHPQACPAVCKLSPLSHNTVTAKPVMIRAFQRSWRFGWAMGIKPAFLGGYPLVN